jgi:hypothetical protein
MKPVSRPPPVDSLRRYLGFEILVVLHESGGWPAEAPNGGNTTITTRTNSKEKVGNKAAAHVGGHAADVVTARGKDMEAFCSHWYNSTSSRG